MTDSRKRVMNASEQKKNTDFVDKKSLFSKFKEKKDSLSLSSLNF